MRESRRAKFLMTRVEVDEERVVGVEKEGATINVWRLMSSFQVGKSKHEWQRTPNGA